MSSTIVERSFVAFAINKKRLRVETHWHWERATGTWREEIVRTYFKKFLNGSTFYDIFYSIVFIKNLHLKELFLYFDSRKKRLESWGLYHKTFYCP
jgi:hypothetical protein